MKLSAKRSSSSVSSSTSGKCESMEGDSGLLLAAISTESAPPGASRVTLSASEVMLDSYGATTTLGTVLRSKL
jgi:hypothetical protein